MLRIREITDAAGAKGYYRQSDYYLEVPGEWLGRGAERLGLAGVARQADFESLCDNIDPATGKGLTAKTVEGRRVGWDFNFNSSKSVGLAREILGVLAPEQGQRIEDAHRESVAFALGHIEDDMQCRVRVDGRNDNRVTGNLVGMRVTHRTTRPNADDKTPDPELHDHVVVFNATRDAVEGKTKAAEIAGIVHDAPYYEALYHNRLAANLKELGYGIRRKGMGFELAGVSDELVARYSRRSHAIDAKAAELGIGSVAGKSQLGATTRLGKEAAVQTDLPGYWLGKLSEEEAERFRHLREQPDTTCDAETAVAYALEHEFTRQAVVDARRLYATALRRGIGSVAPDEVEREAERQGLLVKDGKATTREMLALEAEVIGFARSGRGCWQPLGAGAEPPSVRLSADQAAAVKHVWRSADRVMLIEGDAGTGKTDAMKVTIPGIDRPGVFLAPSASASRGTLRDKGFGNADTIARFLTDERFREQARGGFIYVDEAPLAGLRPMAKLFRHADELGARVILQGDRKQHAAVDAGSVFSLLEQYSGCPVARLTEIFRQTAPDYKQAVAAMAAGDVGKGLERLEALGWVERTPDGDRHAALASAYADALDRKASVLAIAPTHREGEAVTQAIRAELKARGVIDSVERTFATLKPLAWTDAEKGDATRYEGGEVLQFTRNTGPYRAGQRVAAADVALSVAKPECFSVYQPAETALARGDVIRITANGRDKSGKHRLNNGAVYTVAGFTGGDVKLENGWVLDRGFGHFTHGRVVTSHASQGMTVDEVFLAMGRESLPAISREQFYVSASRGRHQARVFTDLTTDELRVAVERRDGRQTATGLMGSREPAPAPNVTPPYPLQHQDEQVKETYRRLRLMREPATAERAPEKEAVYER